MVFRLFFISSFLFLISSGVQAQEPISQSVCEKDKFSHTLFENRPWHDSLVASPREPQTMLLTSLSKPFGYTVNNGNRIIWDVSIGKEIPIVVWDKGHSGDMQIDKGCWGLGIWLPVSFHTVLDFKEPSQPIVNTDYRLAVSVKGAYGLSDRDRIGMKFLLGHESSHLGDEVVLKGVTYFIDEFIRVDVNYEYYEFSVSWDRLYSWGLLTQRFGGSVISSFSHKGFYGTNVFGKGKVFPSERNFEPNIGLQYMPNTVRGWRPYLSYTGNLLTTYDYTKEYDGQKEKSRYSQSFVLGLRDFGRSGREIPDLVMSAYRGRNKHGQYRDQNTYWTFGFGIYIRI